MLEIGKGDVVMDGKKDQLDTEDTGHNAQLIRGHAHK